MALKGDLKSISLANVLQDLASNEQTGTLSIRTTIQQRHFWFEKGKLRLVGLGNGKGPTVLNGLLALGKVKAGDVSGRSNVTLVRGLVKKGSVSRDDVRAALEQQMKELLCDVFVWSEATFEFIEGDPDEDTFESSQLDYEMRQNVDPVIMEALRRVDEWTEVRKTVLSADEILVALREVAPDADATVVRVSGLLDGERRLRDVMDQTHLGEFVVFRAAAQLLRTGAARTLTVKEALDRAKTAASKKQFAQALKMARFVLEREPQNVDARAQAGFALESLDRAEEAASEYRRLVSAQAEIGQKDQAVETCRKILALAPRDSFTHERLFTFLIELRKKTDAVQQGEALAVAYKRAGLPDKAKEIYTRLIQAFGDDDELLESAGEVARRLGDKKEAIGLYRRLFDRALARGDNDAIVLHARTILRLDPTAEDIAKRRMEVETGVYRKRQKMRRTAKIALTLLVLLIAAGAAGAYELKARSILSEIRQDAITKKEKNVGALLRRYNEWLDGYGWSLSVAEVQRERNKLEEAYIDDSLPTLPVGNDNLLEALAKTRDILSLVRQKAIKDRVEDVRSKLSRQAGELGNRYIQDAATLAAAPTPAALTQIEGMTHPLALDALRQIGASPNVDVRKAVVRALGANGSYSALMAITERLATDSDSTVKELSLAQLREKTREDFGTSANAWSEWLRKRLAQTAPGQVPPLNAIIVAAKSQTNAGEPIIVEWRLENIGATMLEFTFTPEFEATDTAGKRLPLKPVPAGSPRRAQLRPGEFIGGRTDLRDLGLDGSFEALVACVAKVNWGGAGDVPVRALPVKISVTPKK